MTLDKALLDASLFLRDDEVTDVVCTERGRIRSFVTRAGRLSTAQARATKTLSPQFCLPYQNGVFNFTGREGFGRAAPIILEIGFGMGQATAMMAAQMPEKNFLGVEVYKPGIGCLLKHIHEQNLTNIRVIQHDAVDVIMHMIAPASLAGVHIFFPDPWHKTRHRKRRLIQPSFIRLLVSRMAIGGVLHCATDWQDYAKQIFMVLNQEPLLKNTVDGFADRPFYRPITHFEKRGQRLGHKVWDCIFQMRDPGL